MTTFNYLLKEDVGDLLLENSLGSLLLETSFVGTLLTNSTAFYPDQSGYTVCHRSGFKAKPDELVRTWDGALVLPKFAEGRHEQGRVRSIPDNRTKGSKTPEADVNWITTLITSDDL